MADSSFRRLDVDQYDEDRVLPSDLYIPDSRPPATVLSDTQGKATAVRGLLQRGDVRGALGEVLVDAPYGEGVDDAKAIALQSILSILNSTKSTDIPAIVSDLNPQEQVTLMKYLYKAMENLGETSGNVVLGWHEKLVESAGTGCIVRVMTDRKRV
ncbi:actin-related protein 2/3 complex subunit 5 [Leucosporidium creatinivorum]|uniref:Actin-related protein 2/3 complex subunit 5 n=1 Tax=Leucosporidium creatinivorum TaxID=106004 RepID=A0A1Y2EY17_9BASI|nr:actin-related protein 2/3 complex subunit 5 [Leucosporidium creatinivorum]